MRRDKEGPATDPKDPSSHHMICTELFSRMMLFIPFMQEDQHPKPVIQAIPAFKDFVFKLSDHCRVNEVSDLHRSRAVVFVKQVTLFRPQPDHQRSGKSPCWPVEKGSRHIIIQDLLK